MEDAVETAWSVIERVLDADAIGYRALAALGTWIIEPETCSSMYSVIDRLGLVPQSPSLRIFQTFKPSVDALQSKGFSATADEPKRPASLALFVPTRQRVESLALLARGLLNLDEQGVLIFACANAQGAGGFVSHLKDAFKGLEVESARKCRWVALPASRIGDAERQVLMAWIDAAGRTKVEGAEFVSVPGIYGWNKIDRGSELLVGTLPELLGAGADLGAGYGYLSHQILQRSKGVTSLKLVEADQRALACARDNLAPWGATCEFLWLDVAAPECRQQVGRPSWIVMNPPFHATARADVTLGVAFIKVAAAALAPGGALYMVANAFLGYEDTLQQQFNRVERVLTQDGFKVIHAVR